MERWAFVCLALAMGCGGTSTRVGPSSTPPNGDGTSGRGASDGGAPMMPDGSAGPGGVDGGNGGDGGSGGDAGMTGRCPTTPQPIATIGTRGLAAADGQYVYGFAAQSIVRVDAEGRVQTIVDDIDTSIDDGLVVDDASVYWTMGDRNNLRTVLWRAPKSGGTPVLSSAWSSTGYPERLAQGPHALYYRSDGAIHRVSTDDGTTSTIAVDGSPIGADAAFVYALASESTPSTGGGDTLILRDALADGATTVLAKWLGNRDNGSVGRAIFDGHTIYVVDEYELRAVPATGGALTELRSPPAIESLVTALASDAAHVYWSTTRYSDAEGPGTMAYVDSWLVRDGAVLASHLGEKNVASLVLMGDSAYLGSAPIWRVCK